MDESRVRRLSDRFVARMKRDLFLFDWVIYVRLDTLQDEEERVARGRVVFPSLGGKKATIILDPKAFGTDEEVLGTIRHELLHIVLAKYEAYHELVRKSVDEKTFAVLDETFSQTTESVVSRLEAALEHGFNSPVSKLLPKSRSRRSGRAAARKRKPRRK